MIKFKIIINLIQTNQLESIRKKRDLNPQKRQVLQINRDINRVELVILLGSFCEKLKIQTISISDEFQILDILW